MTRPDDVPVARDLQEGEPVAVDVHDGSGVAIPPGLESPDTPASRGRYLRLVHDRSFRLLWGSGFVSGLGDWLVIGLLIPLVSQLSGGSASAVAGIMVAKIVPSLFFGSVIGVFVDRFDRRRLMITCDVVRALLVLGLLFTNSLAVIYLVVFAMEVASLFFFPSKNALIPHLVSEDLVAAANGLSYTTQQASMLVGLSASGAILAVYEATVRFILRVDPPLVGRLVGLVAPDLLGPRAGVVLDSTTFLVSAVMITMMGTVAANGRRRERRFDLRLVGADVVESFRFLHTRRELRGLIAAIGLAILGGGAIIPVGFVYVKQLVGGVPFLDRVQGLARLSGSSAATFMLVFLAVGMVSGALLVPRLINRVPVQPLFIAGIAGFGVSMFGFASVRLYAVAALFAAGAGLCLAGVTVAGNTYIVDTVADEIRGRVFTALESVIRVSLLLSMIVTAPLGDIVGGFVRRYVDTHGISPRNLVLTGPRLTLMFASLIVLGAAVFAYRNMRSADGEGEVARD